MQTRKENVGEQSESVFCLHIAAGLLIGSEFNQVFNMHFFFWMPDHTILFLYQPECLKLTNQGQTKYNRTKRSIEKMLKIEKNLSIKDICISMSLGEAVQNYAVKLLQKYTETNNRDVDTSLPQYTAMAVCQAVKQLKIVMRNKKRLVALSYLTARKWNEFDQQWMKLGLKVDDNGAEQNVENAETIDGMNVACDWEWGRVY